MVIVVVLSNLSGSMPVGLGGLGGIGTGQGRSCRPREGSSHPDVKGRRAGNLMDYVCCMGVTVVVEAPIS